MASFRSFTSTNHHYQCLSHACRPSQSQAMFGFGQHETTSRSYRRYFGIFWQQERTHAVKLDLLRWPQSMPSKVVKWEWEQFNISIFFMFCLVGERGFLPSNHVKEKMEQIVNIAKLNFLSVRHLVLVVVTNIFHDMKID